MSWTLMLLAAAAGVEPSGQIAFVSGSEQEDQCVCVLDLANGAVSRVGPGHLDGVPRWSPDGEWLAFTTRQGDGMAVYVVRGDGSEGRILSHSREWNHNPRWSADGKYLAYSASSGMDLKQSIVVYDVENNTETDWGGGRPGLLRPVWMPSLRLMKALNPAEGFTWEGVDTEVFVSEAFTTGAITAIGVDGKPGAYTTEAFLVTQSQTAPLLQLLPGSDSRRYAEWAMEPDGKGERLAYESNDGGDREIFVIDIRGVTDVSNHRAADWNPVWSPDGAWLAFESFRGGRRGVYRVFPSTARVLPVSASPAWDSWAPAWSPDSHWIAFVSDQTGDPDLFISSLEGQIIRQLTHHPGPDYAPAWRPEKQP